MCLGFFFIYLLPTHVPIIYLNIVYFYFVYEVGGESSKNTSMATSVCCQIILRTARVNYQENNNMDKRMSVQDLTYL